MGVNSMRAQTTKGRPMSWPYLHLVTNHFPIILAVTGTIAALAALVLRHRTIWIYAVATLSFAGLASAPAFLSGNQAEEVMEDRPGIGKQALDSHEEAGEAALWVMLAMSGVAAAAWWRILREERRGPSPAWIRPIVLVAALAGTGVVSYTAFLGGKIVHANDGVTAARAAPAQVPVGKDEDADER
ncbi:MAG: hypothetical protein HY700_08050 [Gemmatimonadetes bacterium]|nr:hypothetical protein [Gemmatimonadota bacterium]